PLPVIAKTRLRERQPHAASAREPYGGLVGIVGGVESDGFVAGADDGLNRRKDRLGRTERDRDLALRIDAQAINRQELGGDALALQAEKSRPCAERTCAEAHFSASMPCSSRCPSSLLGKSLPPVNNAVPMPVPKVSMTTVPVQPRPLPKRISARPAASASFRNSTGRASAREASATPLVASQ